MIDNNRKPINKSQVFIGLVALLIGTLVYFVSRAPDDVYFVYRFGFILKLHNMMYGVAPDFFGSLSPWLPEFIHVFSFILLTAGVIACGKRGYAIICIGWFAVDALFELGQKYSSLVLKIIPSWFSGIPILESTEGFFRKGTFDMKDIFAIIAGTVVAYIVLLVTTGRKKRSARTG
jgi:hypothetical protein